MESVITVLNDRQMDPALAHEIRDTHLLLSQQTFSPNSISGGGGSGNNNNGNNDNLNSNNNNNDNGNGSGNKYSIKELKLKLPNNNNQEFKFGSTQGLGVSPIQSSPYDMDRTLQELNSSLHSPTSTTRTGVRTDQELQYRHNNGMEGTSPTAVPYTPYVTKSSPSLSPTRSPSQPPSMHTSQQAIDKLTTQITQLTQTALSPPVLSNGRISTYTHTQNAGFTPVPGQGQGQSLGQDQGLGLDQGPFSPLGSGISDPQSVYLDAKGMSVRRPPSPMKISFSGIDGNDRESVRERETERESGSGRESVREREMEVKRGMIVQGRGRSEINTSQNKNQNQNNNKSKFYESMQRSSGRVSTPTRRQNLGPGSTQFLAQNMSSGGVGESNSMGNLNNNIHSNLNSNLNISTPMNVSRDRQQGQSHTQLQSPSPSFTHTHPQSHTQTRLFHNTDNRLVQNGNVQQPGPGEYLPTYGRNFLSSPISASVYQASSPYSSNSHINNTNLNSVPGSVYSLSSMNNGLPNERDARTAFSSSGSTYTAQTSGSGTQINSKFYKNIQNIQNSNNNNNNYNNNNNNLNFQSPEKLSAQNNNRNFSNKNSQMSMIDFVENQESFSSVSRLSKLGFDLQILSRKLDSFGGNNQNG